MKNVAVILSGCGVFDGAEINESIFTLLELEKNGAHYQCFAPDIPQAHVVNHLTGEVAENETRNVLVESARICRGNIKDIKEAKVSDFDALIFPGGFGAAKNLSDFAFKGAECGINNDVLAFTKAMAKANKPVGFICISPAMIPQVYGTGTKLTVGNDPETSEAIEKMGGVHIACPVSEFIFDETHKVVSTPAYMLADNMLEAYSGIEKLVKKVLELV